MSQTGSYITSLVWETTDSEGPTRSEYQINWNAMDGHLHDNRGAGRGVRGIQTTAAPTQTGDIQINGDTLSWWGASGSKVISAAASDSPVITGAASITSTGTTDLSGAASETTKVLDLVFTDEAAPAAPGAGKTALYTVSGVPHYRAGVSGVDTALGIYKVLGVGTANTDQQITTTASPGTTITGLSKSCTADGVHDVYVTVTLPNPFCGAGSISLAVRRDGTIIGTAFAFDESGNGWISAIQFTAYDAAPAAGAHTYDVVAWHSGVNNLHTLNGNVAGAVNLMLVEQKG